MKTFCYFVVIFFILLSNIGLAIKAKFEKLSPPIFFLFLVLSSIIVFSCIVVAIDLTFKIINLGG